MASVEHFITSHEQTQINRVHYFQFCNVFNASIGTCCSELIYLHCSWCCASPHTGITEFILIYFENRVPLKPVLEGVVTVARFITSHEQTQLNRVCYFPVFGVFNASKASYYSELYCFTVVQNVYFTRNGIVYDVILPVLFIKFCCTLPTHHLSLSIMSYMKNGPPS